MSLQFLVFQKLQTVFFVFMFITHSRRYTISWLKNSYETGPEKKNNIDEYIKRPYYQSADSYHIEAYYAILTTSINPTKPLDRGVCLPISRGQAEELIVETTNIRGRTN